MAGSESADSAGPRDEQGKLIRFPRGSNWTTPNECPAGRSLEINQSDSVENGKGSAWIAYSPSPAITIVGATTPAANSVAVDCMLHTDGFQAFFAWSSGGSKPISSPYGCSRGSWAFSTGIDEFIAPSSWFGWGVTCTNASGCSSQWKGQILGNGRRMASGMPRIDVCDWMCYYYVMRSIGERSTDPGLLVLTSLAEGPKHGYAITLDVERLAGVKLGPGTLYGAVSRLEEKGLIEALPAEDRRHPYRLTGAGSAALAEHLQTLERVARSGLDRLRVAQATS